MGRLGLVLIAVVAAVAGCAAPTGEDRAREQAFATAKQLARQGEISLVSRSDLGPGSVAYLSRLVLAPDTVLGSWSKPGFATDGDLVGWLDVAMTRTSTNDVFTSGAEVTVCFRFTVRWSDDDGAQYRYTEQDCPS